MGSGIPGTGYSVGSIEASEHGEDEDGDEGGLSMGVIAGGAAGGVIISKIVFI